MSIAKLHDLSVTIVEEIQRSHIGVRSAMRASSARRSLDIYIMGRAGVRREVP